MLSFIPAFMLAFIPPLALMFPFVLPLEVPVVLLPLFQLAEFIPVVPFIEPLALELPFTFPEVFADAEPEVPVVPVEPLALNELLPVVPVVPLTLDELLVPEVLSVLVGLTALFIPVVLFLDESKPFEPYVVVSLLFPDAELLLVDPLLELKEEEPLVPVVAEPDVLAFPDTDAPVLTEPETPVVAEPEVPVVAEPETPVEPLTPVVPFTPVDPLTPEVVLPFTKVEPFTPVPTDPETLPEVAAVPLFKEDPVDTEPFMEPDAFAFMPAPEVPLFH